MTIVVEKSLPGALESQTWSFWIDDQFRIYLQSYASRTRTSRRHGWKLISYWSRLETRSNTMDQPLEVPNNVKEDLKRQIDQALKPVNFL